MDEARRGDHRVTVAWTLGLACLMEAVTCALRFGLALESTRDTAALGAWTFGLRIHHGYVGLLILALSPLLRRRPAVREWAVRVGGALLLSDLIHHFLVLWPITGSPQFDLTYPPALR